MNYDIWYNIFEIIIRWRLGSTYKSLIFLNSGVARIGYQFRDRALDLLANHLQTLVKMYPRAPWNFALLSSNANITWKFIQSNSNLPWFWFHVTSNPNLTWHIIKTHKTIDFNHNHLFVCKTSNTNMFVRNPNFLKSITPAHRKIIKQYPNWSIIWFRKDMPVTFENIEDRISFISSKMPMAIYRAIYYCVAVKKKCNWSYFEMSSKFPIEFIIEKSEWRFWDWGAISGHNSSLTWEKIVANPNLPWNYNVLMRNKKISFNTIMANRHKFKDLSHLSWNPDINIDIIRTYSDSFKWNWAGISANKRLTWRIISDNIDLPWNFDVLSANLFNWKIKNIIN